jgi:hypothetical protein
LVWLFLIATQEMNLALAPGRLAQVERGMQFLDEMESRRIPDEEWLSRSSAGIMRECNGTTGSD